MRKDASTVKTLRVAPDDLNVVLYLESEKQLDGVGERCRLWQTEPRGKTEEEEVEEGPGETQCWGMPSRHGYV